MPSLRPRWRRWVLLPTEALCLWSLANLHHGRPDTPVDTPTRLRLLTGQPFHQRAIGPQGEKRRFDDTDDIDDLPLPPGRERRNRLTVKLRSTDHQTTIDTPRETGERRSGMLCLTCHNDVMISSPRTWPTILSPWPTWLFCHCQILKLDDILRRTPRTAIQHTQGGTP